MLSTDTSRVRWLMIDASRPGQMRFATALPAARPRIEQFLTLSVDGLPTFTDALQKYERDSGQALRGTECVLAMPGAVSGEMLTMIRSRWTISRAGLSALFGKPVSIVNDVAARAWALRAGSMSTDVVRGVGSPSLQRAGRYLMLLVEAGVGASAIDVDREGTIRVLETEAGNIDFAPSNEREEKLAAALRGAAPFVSWERMLTLEAADPVWRTALPELGEPERQRVQAAILGRFVVNLIHVYGAWQGVMLTGSRAQRLLSGIGRPAFEGAFGARRDFTRLLISTPVWRVEQHEAVLTGGAELLAQSWSGGPGAPLRNAA